MSQTRKMVSFLSFLKLHSGKLFAISFVCVAVGLIGTTLKMKEELVQIKNSLKAESKIIDEKKSRYRRDVVTRSDRADTVHVQGGAVYTRWGRTRCPSTDTELVYQGTVAGGHTTHTGGSSEVLCLHGEPQWNGFTDAGEGGQQYIYGAEFKSSVTFFEKTNAEKFLHHDVVCAVCWSRTRVSQLMIPARRECPAGWTKEYEGYLMTAAYTYKSKYQHICVDKAPEADAKGYESKGGVGLHFVQAACGSLPCPSYSSGRELTCVVCTR